MALASCVLSASTSLLPLLRAKDLLCEEHTATREENCINTTGGAETKPSHNLKPLQTMKYHIFSHLQIANELYTLYEVVKKHPALRSLSPWEFYQGSPRAHPLPRWARTGHQRLGPRLFTSLRPFGDPARTEAGEAPALLEPSRCNASYGGFGKHRGGWACAGHPAKPRGRRGGPGALSSPSSGRAAAAGSVRSARVAAALAGPGRRWAHACSRAQVRARPARRRRDPRPRAAAARGSG
ncbi:PREDICTED: uncharacterized protein LOC106149285, partial [Chinchilla lanigera]|uniref:uncharacterized protein LOC106149285 n=1 Tax=Chinchilla lanigera TaxID=34839 RepID=UPI00069796FD